MFFQALSKKLSGLLAPILLISAISAGCQGPDAALSSFQANEPSFMDVGFTGSVFFYYPKSTGSDSASCPVPQPLPAGTVFTLKTAEVSYSCADGTTGTLDVTDHLLQVIFDSPGTPANSTVTFTVAANHELLDPTNTWLALTVPGVPCSTTASLSALTLDFLVALPGESASSAIPYTFSMPANGTGGIMGFHAGGNSTLPVVANPGDCPGFFTVDGTPTQGQIRATQQLTVSNSSCGGVNVPQAWPSNSQLVETGPAVVTTTTLGNLLTVNGFDTGAAFGISPGGQLSVSLNLSEESGQSLFTVYNQFPQITSIAFPAKIMNVPGIPSNQIFQVVLSAPQVTYFQPWLSDSWITGNCALDYTQMIAQLTFGSITLNGSQTLAAINQDAALCAGAACLDGSPVVACPVYTCSASGGSGAASQALQCQSQCLSQAAQTANCNPPASSACLITAASSPGAALPPCGNTFCTFGNGG